METKTIDSSEKTQEQTLEDSIAEVKQFLIIEGAAGALHLASKLAVTDNHTERRVPMETLMRLVHSTLKMCKIRSKVDPDFSEKESDDEPNKKLTEAVKIIAIRLRMERFEGLPFISDKFVQRLPKVSRAHFSKLLMEVKPRDGVCRSITDKELASVNYLTLLSALKEVSMHLTVDRIGVAPEIVSQLSDPLIGVEIDVIKELGKLLEVL